ncbi:Fic family protein [Sediminibacterium sp.]|uniref:Fic family protein n=1 Tax=Sediminibacterium sp. TaxID=1917865 RepID=UPI0027377192|nr:Fic family protein [Sediminibacterium sp.]MDP3394610.1 Fic family protein [Sediminibacterium sp.]MDP3568445.1 Fic family protein [Sediminibacterium sp.]
MSVYIHQLPQWPKFSWNQESLTTLLTYIRNRQGRLMGRMEAMGFQLKAEANLQTLTLDVLKSSEIEGELLDVEQVRSSIARKLGMDIAGLVPTDRYVDGVVEMLLDATQNYQHPLSADRLYGWHAALFPTGRSGIHKITVAAWRDNTKDDPMQVVSGALGKEKVHFEAPNADRLEAEMRQFIDWFNEDINMDPVIKAAVAHLWFITIHPFDDGNGRIARAIADMLLSRADESAQRFYSMSAQIRKERKHYYEILESAQKGSMDITEWLTWFLHCLDHALEANTETLSGVLKKARFWEKHGTTILNIRQQNMLNMLLDGFEGKLNSSKWAKITKTSSDTALRDIQDLMNKNILMKEVDGGRSTSYVLIE